VEAEYTITAIAEDDGELSLFLTGALGELSEDWGEGELVNGAFAMDENIDGSRYADLEIEDTDAWVQAFVIVTGEEDDNYSVSISGEDIYESIYESATEPPLTFWTQGGDYTLEVRPYEEDGESLTVVVLLGAGIPEVAVGEESSMVLEPGVREIAVRFTVEEAYREYTVTLQGDDDLDVDMAVSINPTQDTWTSWNSGTDETVTFVAPSAGDYYIRAHTSSTVEDPFPMTVLVEAGEAASALVPGERLWGEVPEGGQVVYSLPIEQEYSLLTVLMVANNDQDLDLSAQLVDDEGNSVSSLSSYNSGATEVIATRVDDPGTFQITVSGSYASDDTPFVLMARVETAGDVGAQFAIEAEASSEAGDDDYAAMQATGAPDVHLAGEDPAAWASADADAGEETLTLTYEHPVMPMGIRIHESLNPGAVVMVEAYSEDDEEWVVLWEGEESTDEAMRVFSPELEQEEILVTQVRLTLDTSLISGPNQIDAVELLGVP